MIPVSSRVGPIVIAHRGGVEHSPENTLEAFSYASSLGIRHIETDVHLSADGHVVVSHDASLERIFGVDAKIADLSYRQISSIRDAQGNHVPLLAEVLTAFPNMYLNVDAKVEGVQGPLLDVIARHRAFNRVVVASFDEDRVRQMREHTHGRVASSLGVGAVARLVGAAKTATPVALWRVPGAHVGAVAVQVPTKYGVVRVLDRRFVAAAHKLGLAVHAWTIDDPADIAELITLGVDGIITNRPRFVRDFLAERGLWQVPPAPGSLTGQAARD